MMLKLKSIKNLLVLKLFFLTLFSQEIKFKAATDINRRGNPFVLLYWNYVENAESFLIYKKGERGEYNILYSSPVSPVRDCEKINRILTDKEKEIIKSIIRDTNVCNLFNVNDTLMNLLRIVGLKHFRIGLILAEAVVDSLVERGKIYIYKIRVITSEGDTTDFLDSLSIKAGFYKPIPSPKNVRVFPGDNEILLRWDNVEGAVGYIVEREIHVREFGRRISRWVKVNKNTSLPACSTDIKGNKIGKGICFLDFAKWNEDGSPKYEVIFVPGIRFPISISGPFNGRTYRYRITPIDILGRKGKTSDVVEGRPVDRTPPSAPEITINSFRTFIEIKWKKVTLDIRGHQEMEGIREYRIYRYESAQDTEGIMIATLPQPHPDSGDIIIYHDRDPELLPEYGERIHYYRVFCVDKAGNISAGSNALFGYVKDTIPPSPPKDLSAEGSENSITLRWGKNTEPDIAGYIVYRGICGKEIIIDTTVDTVKTQEGLKEVISIDTMKVPFPLSPIARIDSPDSSIFVDLTIPEGSEICYKYSVRAIDRTENISDTSKTVCEKLRDRTPPLSPVLTALKARERKIIIEWISPPVQDLFGFIVERSENGRDWVRISEKLELPSIVRCEDLPPYNIWAMDTTFSFTDTTVLPKKIYYYRVKSVDYSGNISPPSTPFETFTYSFDSPLIPEILEIRKEGKNVVIRWKPGFYEDIEGFAVFRSNNRDRDYIQISPFIKNNSFTDKKIMPGRTYYYKILLIHKEGTLSYSEPVRVDLP